MAQINHTGTMIRRSTAITAMTVFICGQMEMMISVTMDGSIKGLGHAPTAVSTYVKRNIKFHCVKISTDNNDLNKDANRTKQECIFSISKPKLI